jgi:hypothetical protein
MKSHRDPQRTRYAKFSHTENVHLQSAYDDSLDLRDRLTGLLGQLNRGQNLAADVLAQGVDATHVVMLSNLKKLGATL